MVNVKSLFARLGLLVVCAVSLHGKTVNYEVKNALVSFLFTGKDVPKGVTIETVHVAGTFTNWALTDDFLMNLSKKKYTLSVKKEALLVPGNSGQPEYQFVINKGIWIKPDNNYPDGYKFLNNFVFLDSDSPEAMKEKNTKGRTEHTSYDSELSLTNFRQVKTVNGDPLNLYRSYHPFIPSRKTHPSERLRLETIQKLMEEYEIHAVINLSDDEGVLKLKSVPAYYKSLYDAGRVLLAETHYNTVYYGTDTEEFNALIRQVFSFTAQVKGPYLVHCRLGTDRTGVVTAVLAAFAGADWKSVEDDYQLSNVCGPGAEYRDVKLLRYAFTRLLGVSEEELGSSTNLTEKMRGVLSSRMGIADDVLDQVYANVRGGN